ncbi:MAG: EI24 domain-containing protein [Paracoccaceae bacterium]|nr:EI24 domain-containing protein [Paracoccaceae bacterium]
MLADFLRALGQIGDRRFRRVLFLGVALSLALLIGVYAAFLWVVQSFTPESLDIPFVGPVGGLGTLLSWGSAVLMIGLSVFLMMPVASAFTSLFLEDVAQAVEDRHYPHLPAVPRLPIGDAIIDSLNFFALLIAVNILALILYAFAGPFIPVVFWAVNGLLLGREYFSLVAMRRLGRAGAKSLRKRHRLAIWVAGTLMAAPLSVPVVNLLIPVLGAATFTHMFHRILAQEAAHLR